MKTLNEKASKWADKKYKDYSIDEWTQADCEEAWLAGYRAGKKEEKVTK